MTNRAPAKHGFEHVKAWVFDLDNTLYPADCNLFAQIDRRMGEFIANSFGIPLEEAQSLRESYYYEHGTTLAGLMLEHQMCPHTFLDYVHDIDLSVVVAAPELAATIDALPGRKFVFTNGSRKHAEAVAERLGLDGSFEDIFDIHALEYIYPKPTRQAYDRFLGRHGVDPHLAAMFDDLPHNLETAHALGMTTVLVDCLTDHPEHQAIADWTELPPHIDYKTDALAPFLAAIVKGLARDDSEAEGLERRGAGIRPSALPTAKPAPPRNGVTKQPPVSDPAPQE